ncbi:MAG: glycosyltransferase family 4 protein [Candidatus Limivicinus sp.]|jgi:glycosyltransferase involved in cell wall biosynthesis
MKIAHIGLASFYTEEMSYQDNELAERNAADGHEVLYISNGGKFKDGKIVETGYEDKLLSSGVRLIRLPYVHILNNFVSDKIRKVKGVYEILNDFSPDVILCHGMASLSCLDAVRYKARHKNVHFLVDCHTDRFNSGMNWLSLHVLHRLFYKSIYQRALPYIDKFLYISDDSRQFAEKNYGIPGDIMEFYPLGGNVPDDNDYNVKRSRRRAELGIGDRDVLLVHSGRLERDKNTVELLKALKNVPELKSNIYIMGYIPEDQKAELEPLIKADSRVKFLGWKSSEELLEYLCACDLYLQPGCQSATMQHALCCRCAVLAYPHDSYKKDYSDGGIIFTKTQEDIENVLRAVAEGVLPIDDMKKKSEEFAADKLDYRRLATRLYYKC